MAYGSEGALSYKDALDLTAYEQEIISKEIGKLNERAKRDIK